MDDLPCNQSKRIGDYLCEAGILTPSQLVVALYDQQRTGLHLGEILVLRGWVSQQTINKFLHQQVRSRLYHYLEPKSTQQSSSTPSWSETETFVVQDFG